MLYLCNVIMVINQNKNTILLTVLLFISTTIFAQEPKKIDYESGTLSVTEKLGPNIKILKDNVTFFHEGATMYCDSAYFNTAENFFDAYGNIQLVKPGEADTVYLYGDTLHYSGKTKLAQVRKNVRLIKDSLVLKTENLDYDLNTSVGTYFDGGTTLNGEDTLTSVLGYYYSDNNEFFFKDSVVVKNPQFKMFSDTLKHNTKTKISYFLGPTQIISDSNYIYCENGWYNHEKDISQFNKNSFLKTKEQTLRGDSLYYDRNLGIGKGYYNVVITDTVQNTLLLGDEAVFYEKKEKSVMTRKALFIQISEEDSLYLHADTLRAYADSVVLDSGKYNKFKVVMAYYHVKIFKSDFQAKCDSLVYSSQDSVMEFYRNPVMWSEENQLTADFISVETVKNQPETVYLTTNAFVISRSDSIRYNQITGDDMVGHIVNGNLDHVDVQNNGKSIYFMKDDAGALIGVNKIECKNMLIFLKDKKINTIHFYTTPKGTMYPPLELNPEDLKYENFSWQINFRPLNKNDVFIWEKEAVPEKIKSTH